MESPNRSRFILGDSGVKNDPLIKGNPRGNSNLLFFLKSGNTPAPAQSGSQILGGIFVNSKTANC